MCIRDSSYFDPSRAVDEDGFSGTIPLESATAAPVTEREQHGVTRADEFSNLTAAEVAALPATRPHQIGDVVVTLSLASVDADPVIIPSIVPRYSGTARYSGSYETETVASYTLTARYAGDLEKEGAAGSLVAVYESIEALSLIHISILQCLCFDHFLCVLVGERLRHA